MNSKKKNEYRKEMLECLSFPISGIEFLQRWNVEKDRIENLEHKGIFSSNSDPFFEGLEKKIQAVMKKYET